MIKIHLSCPWSDLFDAQFITASSVKESQLINECAGLHVQKLTPGTGKQASAFNFIIQIHPFHQSATPDLSTLLPWVYHNGGATKVRSVQRWFGIRGLFRCSVPLKKDLWSLPRKKRFRMCKNHKKSGVRCGMSVQFVFLITVTSLSRFFLIYKNHLNCVWCLVTFPWAPSSLETNSDWSHDSSSALALATEDLYPFALSTSLATRRSLLPMDHVGGTKVEGGGRAWSTSAWRSFHLACSGMFPIQSFLDGSLNPWQSPRKKVIPSKYLQYLHKR